MNEKLKNLLNYDPLAEAEKMTGESYKESDATTWLGIGLLQENRKAKEALLREKDDSLFQNKLEDYVRIITNEGFEKVLEIPFEYSDREEVRSETFFVYWKSS